MNPPPRGPGVLDPQQVRRFYDRFGKKLDSQGFYENPALADLLAHLDMGKACQIVEFGCGTGRLAAEILRLHAPPGARYLGIDSSSTMVRLAQERLRPFAGRAKVIPGDGSMRVEADTASADRFLCTYVLDLLSGEDARALLDEAYRVLKPGGLLGITSLSAHARGAPGLVSRIWTAMFRLSPQLTGGCRPINAGALLAPAQWRVVHCNQLAPFAVPSDVIAAQKPA